MSAVGIVIVTYHSAEVIGECLTACQERGQVVVVDNASTDDTVARVREFPAVRLLANSSNRGFAAACNQGVAALDAPFLLLLNPDAVLLTGLDPLVAACQQPGVGYAGGKLVGSDGVYQRGFAVRRLPTPVALTAEVLGVNRLWPGNPVNRAYRQTGHDERRPGPAEQPAGAFLMFRREAWQQIGGLDEAFHPLWFEDVDFCRRLQKAGWTGQYAPGAVARHRGAHSAGQLSAECRPVYWYGSLLKYAGKHYGPAARRVVSVAVLVTTLLRLLGEVLFSRARGALAAYRQVWRLGWVSLWRPL